MFWFEFSIPIWFESFRTTARPLPPRSIHEIPLLICYSSPIIPSGFHEMSPPLLLILPPAAKLNPDATSMRLVLRSNCVTFGHSSQTSSSSSHFQSLWNQKEQPPPKGDHGIQMPTNRTAAAIPGSHSIHDSCDLISGSLLPLLRWMEIGIFLTALFGWFFSGWMASPSSSRRRKHYYFNSPNLYYMLCGIRVGQTAQ